MTFRSLIAPFLFSSLAFKSCWGSCTGPTKVFLLTGQSNMVGMAAIEHLSKLLNDSATHDTYAPLWNETDNDWFEREDVFCKFNEKEGGLKVGFGAPGHGGHFGPELGFGWTIGDSLCDCKKPIFLLKAAYGGRDLAIDFRPPSSGKGNYPNVLPVHYGWEYRQMIIDVLDALGNLDKLVPGYNDTLGYELAGLVWFQGWNDMVDTSWQKIKEYPFNLANFIRDVRDDLDAPEMQVIVGGMGQLGLHPEGRGKDRYLAMQKAQESVTLLREYKNSTVYIPTAEYLDFPGNDTYNGDYHYYGRADVYYNIGKAFGRGMLKLLGDTGCSSSPKEPSWSIW